MIRRERNGGRDALVAAAPRRRPSPHRTRQARPFTHWRGTENDRMERGREMIGLSYRSSTREGRACRGRTPSASVPPIGRDKRVLPVSYLSRPHPVGVRPPIGRDKRVPPVSYLSRPHPVGVRPPIGRDKRVPPVSYFLRISARSVLTGRRLGVASQRPAPRRRGYIACRGCTRRKSSRRTYPFCYAMMHTSKR